MDWCLDLCYLGGGTFVYNFFGWGWGWYSLEFLGDKSYKVFFYFLFNFFRGIRGNRDIIVTSETHRGRANINETY